MQSITLAKCIAIAESHFLYTPYKNLSIDKIYGVDGIGNKASRICHYCSVDVLKSILETSSLRFSDVRFLNDSTEFVEIIPLLKFVVEQGGYEAEFKDIILDEALIRKLKSYKQGYVGRKKDTNELVKKIIEHIHVPFQRSRILFLCGIIMRHLEMVLILPLILHGIYLTVVMIQIRLVVNVWQMI